MQFSFVIAALAATVIAAPAPQASAAASGSVDPNLVPQFGVQANQNPDGTGNCDGAGGKKIPCFCPPDRNAFIQKMQQFVGAGNALGTPVSFPTDNSAASQKQRLTTSIITLQNFNGTPGVGCPAASTTFVQQQQQIQG
jgi:hypothetical protein